MTQLRVLSLKQNHLLGLIPDLSNLTALKLLFLSHDYFSGEFPPSMPTLFRLYRLNLSYYNFFDEVPILVNDLAHLLTLRLKENRFFDSISSLNLPNLQDFNVSGDRFSNEIQWVTKIFFLINTNWVYLIILPISKKKKEKKRR